MPSKTRALVYLSLAAAGLTLLGLSLPGLALRPGLPIPGARTGPPTVSSAPAPSLAAGYLLPGWLQGVLALVAVVLLVAIGIALLRKIPWKRITALLAGLLLLFVLFSLLPAGTGAPSGGMGVSEATAAPPAFVYRIEPLGDPPAGLLRALMIALVALALGAAGWLLVRALRQPREPDRLADELDAAVQAIAAGQDLNGVVIRCYLQMERAVAAEHGLERPQDMTAREFETRLEQRGAPAAPVQALTRLFEQARYGRRPLDRQDEDAAVRCLSAIRAALAQTRQALG